MATQNLEGLAAMSSGMPQTNKSVSPVNNDKVTPIKQSKEQEGASYMVRGINQATILGWVGNDPEIKNPKEGLKLAVFNVATGSSWKDKNTDEWKEKTTWHRVVCFQGYADSAEKIIKKGAEVYIQGRLEVYNYEDDDGNKQSLVSIVPSVMHLCGGDTKLTKVDPSPENKETGNLPF